MLSKNQIKQIQSLHLKKFRESQQLFIAEGVKTVLEIVNTHAGLIKELFATPDFIAAHPAPPTIHYTEVTEAELTRISGQQAPNKVLAVCGYLPPKKNTFSFNTGFSLYLDEIRDPGNFGTLLRLADWYGISTVFCSPGSCELYNPKVIQASMGAFLRVQVVYTSLIELKAATGIKTVYGALLHGSNLYRTQLSNGLIVIGNEANGISDENLPLIDQAITIPSHQGNGTESLNAAVAASILVSEFYRQLKVN